MTKREKIKYIIENEGSCGFMCEYDKTNPCPLIRKIGYCSTELNLTRAKQWLKDNPEEKQMNTPISKDILNRIEHLEELAGIKKEIWPQIGNDYFFMNDIGDIKKEIWYGSIGNKFHFKNLIIFKTGDDADKYHYIIDTINNIVDELGRPCWDDFIDNDIYLHVCEYNVQNNIIDSDSYSEYYFSQSIFPYCKKTYRARLLKKVSQPDLIWVFKKSMRLI